MNQEDKRKEFIRQFAVQVKGISQKDIIRFTGDVDQLRKSKLEEEAVKTRPTLGEFADGYRTYITDLGEGFLELAEIFNMCIEYAKLEGFLKQAKLSARIKDFSSCMRNTDKKILDDVFGMEVVTNDELDKEILILFSQIAFNTVKEKSYNKANGYKAHHCVSDVKRDEETDVKSLIQQLVMNKKTKEYKRSKDNPNYKNDRNMRFLFPNLQEYITDKRKLNRLTKLFENMMEYIKITNKNLQFPPIEFHFLTADVKLNCLKGQAKHSAYKGADKKKVIDKFEDGKIIRGINSPLKFNRNTSRIKASTFLSNNM